MQKGDPSGQAQNNEKRRRSQSKFNKDLPRYECFCSKQYLSYPALYLHMKNKHNDYFQSSKSGKKVEPTKLIESYNHAQGYKVYKIAVDANLLDKDMPSGKYFDNNFVDKGNLFVNPNGNYIGYQNMNFNPHFGYLMNQNHINAPIQREVAIEIALTMFMQTLADKPTKYRYEAELFFTLLVECLNKNYGKINDARTDGKQVERYTAQYNSQHIMDILPYFQAQYVNHLQNSKPYSFFIKKSHIISSGQYVNILGEFYHYVFSKKAGKINQPNQSSDEDQEYESEPNNQSSKQKENGSGGSGPICDEHNSPEQP